MDYAAQVESRVQYIKHMLEATGAKGIVVGNSGGKDCALVMILARRATANVLSVMLPCGSVRNYSQDIPDGTQVTEKFDIPNVVVDLTPTRDALLDELNGIAEMQGLAKANINPRLRMTVLYALAQAKGYLVAGTGNKCEGYVGYFTKWGDGAHDFNPISDLTVSEIYAMLKYLGAPSCVITKAPSAALYEGQTDETEMGVTYDQIERYLAGEAIPDDARAIIERMHRLSEHKRQPISTYEEWARK